MCSFPLPIIVVEICTFIIFFAHRYSPVVYQLIEPLLFLLCHKLLSLFILSQIVYMLQNV